MLYPHVFENAKVLSDFILHEEEKYIQITKQHPQYIPEPEFANDASSELFVMTCVGHNRYSLKPNLSQRGFLFRGETEFHSPSVANFYRTKEEGKKVRNNAKRDEFNMLFYSHPLVQMLRFGVSPKSRTLRFAVGPYGAAQHYLYETSLIDFTSWLTVAIFFATNSTGDGIHYTPYDGQEEIGYLYVYKIQPGITFKPYNPEIVTLGLQPFPRSGIQRGFALQSTSETDLRNHPNIDIFQFRHDRTQAQIANDFFKGGKRLFPDDDLSTMSDIIRIRYKNEISLEAFEFHKRFNPHCPERYLLDKFGEELKVVDKNPIIFDSVSLAPYYHINQYHWEDFCRHIYNPFVKDNGEFVESMINLRERDEYAEFFYQENYNEVKLMQRLQKQLDIHVTNNSYLLDSLSL